MTIKRKIAVFTGVVLLIIVLSALVDVWIIKVPLMDFNHILQDNAKSSELVDAMEEESVLFEEYMRYSSEEQLERLQMACKRTSDAVENLPFDYTLIGDYRYAKTWSIKNTYEIYREERDQMIGMQEENPNYIRSLYAVYDMQTYLQEYARTLMRYTMEDGSRIYQEKIPMLRLMVVSIILLSLILLEGMVKLARLMNWSIISPVMNLVKASKRIAANDFFGEDVTIENKDELGELVKAFNKMKYATGEYILALEERRETLELLHKEEVERIEVEKRLEMTKLELLKSQINPHFLFNTLNVIAGMANLEDAATTEKMIGALSALFRYNLKTTEEEVPLAKELKVVKDYMYLQQMRFGSRIQYSVESRVDADRVRVPSFLFQPLVENSIIHGLSKKEEGGRIIIRIWMKERKLFITIVDTGSGIPEDKLKQIREQLEKEGGSGHKDKDKNKDKGRKENSKSHGIGLGNVYKRICGMYQNGDMKLYSRTGAGTAIQIVIPQEGTEVENDVSDVDCR